MLGVGLDRFDYEIQLIGAVDLAGDAVGLAWLQSNGFSEVMKPVEALRVAIKDEQHRAGAMLGPLKQEEMIGAEVEHKRAKARTSQGSPRPSSAPLRGYPADSSVTGYRTARRMPVDWGGGENYGRVCCCRCLRKLSPPSKNTSEFSTKRSAIAVAIVVLCRMLPHSENAVFVVITVERLEACRALMT